MGATRICRRSRQRAAQRTQNANTRNANAQADDLAADADQANYTEPIVCCAPPYGGPASRPQPPRRTEPRRAARAAPQAEALTSGSSSANFPLASSLPLSG